MSYAVIMMSTFTGPRPFDKADLGLTHGVISCAESTSPPPNKSWAKQKKEDKYAIPRNYFGQYA